MADNKLPAELWNYIFDLAADEDVIYQYGLPDFTAEHAWLKIFHSEWSLRAPQMALDQLQRQSYITKKAIISTCKFWNCIGTEFLYRCLFFDRPAMLVTLAQRFASYESRYTSTVSPGWWTKRIHIRQYYSPRSLSQETIDYALASIVKSCPNLEIFVVDWPLTTTSTFMRIADSLATYSHKNLRTIHWKVPCETLPKVIWALDSLPYLLSANISFKPPVAEDAIEHLGSAFDVHLTLRYLQQLFVEGYVGEFLEQASGWSLPALRSLSIDCGVNSHDQPDVVAFLTIHGGDLMFLNLSSIPPLDVRRILDLCPSLVAFSFNADWRLEQQGSIAMGTDQSLLVNRPHEGIRFIGLHGLQHAFGVGVVGENATRQPLPARFISRTNDSNVESLNRRNFPNLQVVRCLNRTLLEDLNKADGPSEASGGLERWDRWYNRFSDIGVRLEDCTGELLGTLPQDHGSEEGDYEDDSDEYEDEEVYEHEVEVEYDGELDEEDEELARHEYGYGYEEEEDEEEGWEIPIPPLPRNDDLPKTKVLRDLLLECRTMNETREESMFPSMQQSMMALTFMGMDNGGSSMPGPSSLF